MSSTEEIVADAFRRFDKWETYPLVFDLVDQRRITLRRVIEIALDCMDWEGVKDPAGVIRMRRQQHLGMKS